METTGENNTKKLYFPPVFVEYGNIEKITLAGVEKGSDDLFFEDSSPSIPE